jgi:hypothetical protein
MSVTEKNEVRHDNRGTRRLADDFGRAELLSREAPCVGGRSACAHVLRDQELSMCFELFTEALVVLSTCDGRCQAGHETTQLPHRLLGCMSPFGYLQESWHTSFWKTT